VFADPPYNIGYAYDQYDDNRDDDEYVQWTCDWIDGCTRLLKPTGSLYVLIGDEFAAETRMHLKKLQREGKLLFRNWIIWHYTFGQRCKVKFNRSHAHLFYCVGSAALTPARKRGKASNGEVTYKPRNDLVKNPPFTFHYDEVALPSARMTTYNDKRTNPRGKLPDDTWYLRRFPSLADWHPRPQEAQGDSGLFNPDEDTWCQSRLCGTFHERTGHPCQLPEALLERIVRVSSNAGDLVFDPFAGSGTTLAVAKRLGRDYLGCEMSEQYAEQVRERLDGVEIEPDSTPGRQDAEAPRKLAEK
ncbi:MAG: DNA-methyltransferase, partial [bacterium]